MKRLEQVPGVPVLTRIPQRVRGFAQRLSTDATARWRLFIVVAAILVCTYGGAVMAHVLTTSDLGIRTAFTPVVNQFFPEFLYPRQQTPLAPNDRITQIGDQRIDSWPQILRAQLDFPTRTPSLETSDPAALNDPRNTHLFYQGQEILRIQYERPGESEPRWAWCLLGRSHVETLAPTVLWFFIKAVMFLVGALVFWKRPDDPSARQFFVLCIVSCGAYLGGYHWWRIVTEPSLLLVFMVCGVLLAPASLHFYLLFPRPKTFYQRCPRATVGILYGVPLAFLVLMLNDYRHIRWLAQSNLSGQSSALAVNVLLEQMKIEIYCYFAVAFLWYLASIIALVDSYRHAQNSTERNQVKWILFGSVAALFPLGYSGYLAVMEQGKFGGGGATWPMFAASFCVTIAFTVSVTRYRLMQLDQLVSSGAMYFAISVLAAIVYYGLVFGGVFLLGRQITSGPSLVEALGVSSTVLVLLFVLDLMRGRLKSILDKHFRREKNQLEQTLQKISQAISQLVDPPTLARRLLQTSVDLLGIERGSVYLRVGEPPLYQLTASWGAAPALSELSPGCPLIEGLLERGALQVRPTRHGAIAGEVSPTLRQLAFLGGELAQPLIHEGRLLALLILGPKKEGNYTEEDLNLLAAFAQVTALALLSSEGGRTIEGLHRELQAKVEKIAEQQRRIIALQTQLTMRQRAPEQNVATPPETSAESDPTPPESGRESTAWIVGSSPAVRQLLDLIRKVASSPSAVLLRGESGTGKELLARALHEMSPRASRPFVKVHCAALSPTLLESELFGHVKGAFTGAVRDRPGRFELANGGSLFLDEIGDISLDVQTKLLRVLQEMVFERVGSSEPIEVDVRIIAATHQNLEELIRRGQFREDLFYRLNVLPIDVPPLRDRCEDIAELVQHFLRIYGQRAGKPNLQIDDDTLSLLKSFSWPGNIRQLENVIERAVVISEGPTLTIAELPEEVVQGFLSGEDNEPVLLGVHAERAERERREREQLVRALAATNGNKAEAARTLGLARSTLVSRLKKYGLS